MGSMLETRVGEVEASVAAPAKTDLQPWTVRNAESSTAVTNGYEIPAIVATIER